MASLAHFIKCKPGLLDGGQQFILTSLRFASKKSGGSSKNLGGKSPGRRYGLKKYEGHFVHAGNILATQRAIRYHPGAHVGMGTNNTIYALEDGHVCLTKEIYVPPPRSPEANQVIVKLAAGSLLYKTFVNVRPLKQEPAFKLVGLF
ncbi:large ribosomal subunit protein bL27m-like [Nerophis ophidion]|uniref:large ribosomal subunit protein bL27m-like n=1 Tax=Nerophis ophidion TaxID=159077 RepID=UPI002AE0625F|nr:large ribosomal subunit protein bL27m-like [Nerophis ophidion]XP_061769924.1 large ribosomal subunit protein bL27m-like [Nerophis ophidion]